MGVHKNISYDKFPKQGEHLGKEVNICFNYNSSLFIKGKCVRDDIEDPYRSLFQLEDGRVISGTECQYQIVDN